MLALASTVMACARSSKPDAAAQSSSAENAPPNKPAGEDPPTRPPAPGDERVPGEYLVTVQNGGDESMIRRLYANNSVRGVRQIREDLFLISVERDPGAEAMQEIAAGSTQIRAVEPNFVYRTNRPPGNLPDQIK